MSPTTDALWLAALLACAGNGSASATPTEDPVTYQLQVPGVVPRDLYDSVRAAPALSRALDAMIAALEGPSAPADKVAAFLAAREQGLEEYAAAMAATPPRPANPEDLLKQGIGPPPGDPVLRTFDKVSTDILRTWFRSYAKHLADTRSPDSELDALAAAATGAFPWAPVEGQSAEVEVKLAKAAMHE